MGNRAADGASVCEAAKQTKHIVHYQGIFVDTRNSIGHNLHCLIPGIISDDCEVVYCPRDNGWRKTPRVTCNQS